MEDEAPCGPQVPSAYSLALHGTAAPTVPFRTPRSSQDSDSRGWSLAHPLTELGTLPYVQLSMPGCPRANPSQMLLFSPLGQGADSSHCLGVVESLWQP